MKLLFVGGHPKGEPEPFSRKTHSGKILRMMVAELQNLYDFEDGYIDLWHDAEEEKDGIVLPIMCSALRIYLRRGWRLIPLGHHVHKAVKRSGLDVAYYCHPARHATRLREQLEATLAVMAFEP